MKRRLPRTVWLDENYSYHVKFEPAAVIAAAYGKPGKAGFTDTETKIIHIDKAISHSRKWAVLRHELVHAIVDLDLEVGGGL